MTAGFGRRRPQNGWTRRALLGAGGAALALPWLEALAPKPAHGQSVQGPRRFLPISFPCGAPDFWWPALPGAGDAFVLTSVMQPFAPIKDRLLLLGQVENGSAFNADGGSSVEPSHGRLSGGFLTCVDGRRRYRELNPTEPYVSDYNAISVDQVLAQRRAGQTPIDSLQVGLSTMDSYCDGLPCSYSRSISWAGPTTPLYKLIDPQQVFDALFGSASPPATSGRRRDRSVIDAVLASSNALEPKLSSSDRQILERYLASLRQVETQLADCVVPARPTVTASKGQIQTQGGYDRGAHIDAMNQLIALAFQCDRTRVISYMLEDERSEFVFSNLEERVFTLSSSVPNGGLKCGDWHGAGQNGDPAKTWSTIQWWHNQKVTELCQLLAAMPEGDGSVLDSTVVLYGSCMHGANHAAADLPLALIAGPKLLATNRYHRFASPVALRDVYFTLLNGVFGLNEESFGDSLVGVANRMLGEVLA